MKKLLVLLLMVFCSVHPGNIYADLVPVKIFSSDFSISGNISGVDTSSRSPYYSSYAESGSVSLSNSVSYGGFYNGASAGSRAGFFLFQHPYGDLVVVMVRRWPMLM